MALTAGKASARARNEMKRIELKSYGKINNILIVKSPNIQNSSILPI